MLGDPQVHARDMVVEVDHPRAGRVKALGHPIKFSDTPTQAGRAAPLLGEHTREVLAQIGYGDEQLAALIREGAVFAA
jgi:crotonobetainyl-CoA:carnitine CoA-transferase CaiB-like acyl-CoA transferase